MLNKHLLTKVYILKLGGSDVTKSVFMSSMPEIHWTIEYGSR